QARKSPAGLQAFNRSAGNPSGKFFRRRMTRSSGASRITLYKANQLNKEEKLVTQVAEKLVLSFESEQGYQPSAHNLSAEQAVDLTRQFASEGRVSKVIDQQTHHRTAEPSRCKLCQKVAADATWAATQPEPEEQTKEESSAASQEESES